MTSKYTQDWTPVWRGDGFCSPACGMGCTRADYTAAVRHAHAMAQRLGPGWRPAVWENLGWHSSIKKGVTEIIFGRTVGEWSSQCTLFHNSAQQTVVTAKTPEQALKSARRTVVKSIARQSKDFQCAFGEHP